MCLKQTHVVASAAQLDRNFFSAKQIACMRKSRYNNSMLVGTTNFHIEANERSSRIVPLYDDTQTPGRSILMSFTQSPPKPIALARRFRNMEHLTRANAKRREWNSTRSACHCQPLFTVTEVAAPTSGAACPFVHLARTCLRSFGQRRSGCAPDPLFSLPFAITQCLDRR